MKRRLQTLIMLMLLVPLFVGAQYFDKVTGTAPANNYAKGYSASWGDYNNDGLDDLIQTDNNTGRHNILFKNMGNGVFQKDTANPIYTTSSANTMGTCWGDYNNDGNLDLLVINNMGSGAPVHHNYLFRNDGAGQWTLITDSPIYTDHGWGLGGSMVDYDNDGWLDIYIANNDTVNFLYHNNGNGTFTRIYNSAGAIVTDNFHTYTAVWADYDNDGWQDCYVVNYFMTLPGENNALYRNNHDGTFSKDMSLVVNNDQATDMSASWVDYDNDGNLDLFTTSYTGSIYSPTNYLYRNNGDGTFTFMNTLVPSMAANQSYGSAWLDFNNDGKLDLVVATNKTGDRHNYLYRNDGGGVFVNITTDPVVTDVLRSMGVSVSDYDNNGYPDIYIDSWSSTTEPGMYRNKGGSNYWVSLKLVGTVSNKSAIGTRITLWRGGQKQIREVASTTGLYCGSSFTQTFGLGANPAIDSVVIRWPSGQVQMFCNIPVNQKTVITEGTDYSANDILTFVLAQQLSPAIIDPVNHTVTCYVLPGTNLSALTPTLTLSPGATVITASGTTQNFAAGPVNYKVISGTCEYQNWLVSVTIGTLVPVTLEINNLVVNYGTDTCFNATQTITVAGSGNYFTVQSGGSATLIAGMNIFLLPGTMVQSGGYLLGTITQNGQYCTQTMSPLKGLISQEGSRGNLNQEFAVSLFPNPAADQVILDLSQTGSGVVSVQVTGIDGRTRSVMSLAGEMKHTLDVSSLDPGVYFVRISDGNRLAILRLVKM
jgi:hypothetical protein